MEVDPWTDKVGGLLERFPRLLIKTGDFETRVLGERLADIAIDRPVYIAGLARSGSTILLELLARHPEAATHRYRDFPLLPVPWAWNWFVDRAGRSDRQATERAHRDGIIVTPESPEAFEEVLWNAFFTSLHERRASAVLDRTTMHPRFEAFYRDHIRKLLALRRGRRYISKGNYNVTRIAYLKKILPDARFIVPVRDPVWHIASLVKQHRLFLTAAAQDERVRRHMRRSGHFEFGPDRRAINTASHGMVARADIHWEEGEEIAGWAAQWADVYGHVADLMEDGEAADAVKIVRYEDFCADPGPTFTAVLEHCGLEPAGLVEIAQTTISPPTYYEPSFTEAERDEIRRITSDVASRFGYD
ncbi:sulfotransferase family protein [Phyllobacterium phragmitis]|uniref:Sulfotransferase family protein n=2 Tax=Phyllobacterium phragmitis TaxID=2670329 RepID=A0A2S9IZL4_9HYPH|nr:sulfotransferase family protein [Phyllobacterium phragmitis]